MKFLFVVVAAVVALAAPVQAQSVKSEVTASNGVVVTVYADEFAGRYEYTAPAITIDSGFALVARVVRGDTVPPISVQGSFNYSGEWRYYTSAVFRGGDPVDYKEGSRDVGRCRASRYSSSCSLSEEFHINLSEDDIAGHAENGVLAMQVRASRSSDVALISVPLTYFDAVKEVSERPRP